MKKFTETPVWDLLDADGTWARLEREWRETRAHARAELARMDLWSEIAIPPRRSALDVLIPPQLRDRRNRKLTPAQAEGASTPHDCDDWRDGRCSRCGA